MANTQFLLVVILLTAAIFALFGWASGFLEHLMTSAEKWQIAGMLATLGLFALGLKLFGIW